MKKASGRPQSPVRTKTISWRWFSTISAEPPQEWQVGRCECICTLSGAKTFGGWPGVKKGSKEATSPQEKHHGQTDILQKVQGLDCWGLQQSHFLFPIVWGIWKNDCLEKKKWALPSVLYHANSKASWDPSCVGLLLIQGSGLPHNFAWEHSHE